ncbi:hypothetical protein [Paraburkholderia nodosa]|uniref:hypothetical protein n=1 Tax=Paraburkholderia nodosa TaxID=392320 RepID=UPI000841E412|nr:hypothetical protein [Paraburkholderia nodosa]
MAALSSAITVANALYGALGTTGQSAIEVAQGKVDVIADAASKKREAREPATRTNGQGMTSVAGARAT